MALEGDSVITGDSVNRGAVILGYSVAVKDSVIVAALGGDSVMTRGSVIVLEIIMGGISMVTVSAVTLGGSVVVENSESVIVVELGGSSVITAGSSVTIVEVVIGGISMIVGVIGGSVKLGSTVAL